MPATMGEIKKAMKTLEVMEKRIVSDLTYLLQNHSVEQDVRQFIVQPIGTTSDRFGVFFPQWKGIKRTPAGPALEFAEPSYSATT